MKLSIDVCTLFADLVRPYTEATIIGRAAERGLVRLGVSNIRDFAPPPHQIVDDAPYGGGGGMVLKAEPILKCVRALPDYGPESRVLVTAARGTPWSDAAARRIAAECGHVVIICGRYEGIDQRVVEILKAEEVSIGDFVISGGEAAAACILDSIVRLLPGSTGDESAQEKDSYGGGLLEHPHYTRPEEVEGLRVPATLLSGDHGALARWRRKEEIAQTLRVRPDLLERALAEGRLSAGDLEILHELGHPAGVPPRKRRKKTKEAP